MSNIKEQILEALNDTSFRQKVRDALTSEEATAVKPDEPSKGDIITLCDGRRYRVLQQVKGTALLLSMSDFGEASFNADSNVKRFPSGLWGQAYAGGELDKRCRKFFEQLPDEIKNAIKPVSIIQTISQWTDDMPMELEDESEMLGFQYNWSQDYDYSTNCGHLVVGERYAFALDVLDIALYFEKNRITSSELNELFFEYTDRTYKLFWLRSACASDYDIAWCVSGYSGCLSRYNYYKRNAVRPAFQIDLSKVKWRK